MLQNGPIPASAGQLIGSLYVILLFIQVYFSLIHKNVH